MILIKELMAKEKKYLKKLFKGCVWNVKKKTKVYYEGYILNRQENRPKIILKLAMTKDNYITLKKIKEQK